MTLTQPMKWHGGKHYLAKRIIELMPPHIHYVEPYFGGGSVLLRKNPEGVSEVVNDVDGELINFWITLRDPAYYTPFVNRMIAQPFSQMSWECAEVDLDSPNRIIRACAFFIRARQSRQGLMKDFATLSRNRTRRGMNEQVSSWLTAIEGLPDVHARLKRVVILNDDAIKVIKQQDGPNTLFYCDPPYLHETRVTKDDYKHEMTKEQHSELLQMLMYIEGKFILSGYNNYTYNNWAMSCGWNRVNIKIDNKASSKKTKEIKTECLWMNFTPSPQKETTQ